MYGWKSFKAFWKNKGIVLFSARVRKQPPEVLFKKSFLNFFFAKFLGKYLCWSHFYIMLQAFRPYINSYTLNEPSSTKKKYWIILWNNWIQWIVTKRVQWVKHFAKWHPNINMELQAYFLKVECCTYGNISSPTLYLTGVISFISVLEEIKC